MSATVYHWWPDCAAWPVDDGGERDTDADHRTAVSPDQVTCAECRRDPDVRGDKRDD